MGVAVGDGVGLLEEGARVGEFDGDTVGSTGEGVGNTVGDGLGSFVGEGEGSEVVGSLVGKLVIG